MATVSTHVLDTAMGRPAAGVGVTLERVAPTGSERLGGGTTDADGRARDFASGAIGPGTYRLRFDTGSYFAANGRETFFPAVAIEFEIADGSQHFHVPLLLSPFGYSTYRGS